MEYAQPAIRSMAVNSDQGLAPGATLRLQLYATPGARWTTVTLGDSGIRVPLTEESPGNYIGRYVVRRGDRIDPRQSMTARARYDGRHEGRTVVSTIDYPPAFQALAGPRAPAIERFAMRPHGRLEPGRELRFRLEGTPGGDAWLDIPGVAQHVGLAEARPGIYEGSYTIRRRDDAEAFERAVATLQSRGLRSTAQVAIRGGEYGWGSGRRGDAYGRRDPSGVEEASRF